MSYTKKELVSILNANKKDIINLMGEVSKIDNNYVTYSKNVFIPITEICKNDCGYCNFKKTTQDEDVIILKDKDEILEELKIAEDYGCSEANFTFGEDADFEPAVQEKLEEYGFETIVDYVYDICKMTLSETTLLPHTNGGNFSYDDFKKLKEVNASMGLMLENSSERLMQLPAHKNSPGKDPKRRIETIANAGKLKIPYTTGLLIGIGENKEEIAESLLTIRDLYDSYGHIQEIIIQNFTPTADIKMADVDKPTVLDMMRVVIAAKLLFKDTPVSIQIPPNLNYDTAQIFLLCGADDWGGVSPVTIDYVNPTSPWPTLDELEKFSSNAGYKLKERLCIYDSFFTEEWLNEELLKRVLNLAEHL